MVCFSFAVCCRGEFVDPGTLRLVVRLKLWRRVQDDRPYDRWLRKLLEHISDHSTNRDNTFSQFIVDLPEVPTDEFGRLCDMCLKATQVQLGFTALRDLAMYRPPARPAAVDVLFGLCTHASESPQSVSRSPGTILTSLPHRQTHSQRRDSDRQKMGS